MFQFRAPMFAGANSGGAETSTPEPMAVIYDTTKPSTGTQTFSDPSISWTPKAAIFLLAGHNSATAYGTPDNYAGYGYGATDGTNEWLVAGITDHGSRNSCGVKSRNDYCCGYAKANASGAANASNYEEIAEFSSFGAGSVTVNWTIKESGSRRVTVILIGGSGTSVACGVSTLTGSGSSVTATPGFETNMLFMAVQNRNAAINTADEFYNCAYGFGAYDGSTITQACYQTAQAEGVNPSNTTGIVRTDRISVFENVSGSINGAITLENITSTQFDLAAAGANFSGGGGCWLAVNWGGSYESTVGAVDSPTSTGDWAVTGTGFRPKAVLLGQTMLTSSGTATKDGTGSAYGIGAFDNLREMSQTWAIEDGTDPYDSSSNVNDSASYLDDHTGANAFDGDLSSLDSDGFTINFTAVPGTARKWFYLATG